MSKVAIVSPTNLIDANLFDFTAKSQENLTPMAKHKASLELRQSVAAALLAAINKKGYTKVRAASELGIKRQSLDLYLRARVMPGGQVIQNAISNLHMEWDYHGYKVQPERKNLTVVKKAAEQLSLLDALDSIKKAPVRIEVQQAETGYELSFTFAVAK